MIKIQNPKLEINGSTRVKTWYPSLTYADLENGDRRIICSSGYYDIPHDSIHKTYQPHQVQELAKNGGYIKNADMLNNKFIILVGYNYDRRFSNHVMICNLDMEVQTIISHGVGYFKIYDDLIYCFPVENRNEIKIFDNCGNLFQSIITSVESPTDIIIKNDGSYLICQNHRTIYAVNKNDSSDETHETQEHQVIRFDGVGQYFCSYTDAFFKLQCGLYMLVIDSSDFWSKVTHFYVIDPNNSKIVTKHVLDASIEKVVCKKNNRFDVHMKDGQTINHFELKFDFFDSLVAILVQMIE